MREAYQEKVAAHLKDLSTKLADLRAQAGPAAARLKEVSEAAWKEARPGIEQAWQELRDAVQRAANSGGRGQQHEREATGSADANKATIRRMLEASNTRYLTFIDDGFSPHFVLHTALTPGWPRGWRAPASCPPPCSRRPRMSRARSRTWWRKGRGWRSAGRFAVRTLGSRL
jgi:hypothetical protein